MRVREIKRADWPALLELNRASVRELSVAMSRSDVWSILAESSWRC
jgi:hypothetical protein